MGWEIERDGLGGCLRSGWYGIVRVAERRDIIVAEVCLRGEGSGLSIKQELQRHTSSLQFSLCFKQNSIYCTNIEYYMSTLQCESDIHCIFSGI